MRIVIGAPSSGTGKTTFSIGLMRVLKNRGLNVSAFKVGPDYIDPMFHRVACGNRSYNLDAWLLDEETLKYLFLKHSRDISVIEGVMGFYDGYGDTSIGSTWHISEILKTPAILVISPEGMARSLLGLLKGYMSLENNRIKGVVFNNVSEHEYWYFRRIVEKETSIKVLGFMPKAEISIPSRHLGLITAGEIKELEGLIEDIAGLIENHVDVDELIQLASEVGPLESFYEPLYTFEYPCRIGVAYDESFNFYYWDNLEMLEEMGAELVYFSPLKDRVLPEVDGLYIGGGYPELYAETLSENTAMRNQIKKASDEGMPIYAECGGLMYLSKAVEVEGKKYEMVGIFNSISKLTPSLQRFGYAEVILDSDCLIGNRGASFRVHEFHYSKTVGEEPTAFLVRKPNKAWKCGYQYKNTLAGYPHIHFYSAPWVCANFVRECHKFKRAKDMGL